MDWFVQIDGFGSWLNSNGSVDEHREHVLSSLGNHADDASASIAVPQVETVTHHVLVLAGLPVNARCSVAS